MKSKRGAEGVIWMVVIIALLLLFLLIYSGAWTKLFGKSVKGVESQLSSTGDADNDGVINVADKCPCPGGEGDIENDGCPAGYAITGKEDRTCLAKK